MSLTLADKIKSLRQRTGVSMIKCKEALEESAGEIEGAIETLRKSGIAGAVKKEGRETKEGLISALESGNQLVLFELSAETDFVVHNEQFRSFARSLTQQISLQHPADLSALLEAPYLGADGKNDLTVEQQRALLVQSLGENIQLKRFFLLQKKEKETFGLYSHAGGKIVTALLLEGSGSEKVLANDLAMHLCASAPEFLDPSQIPTALLEKEREIARMQVQDKPVQIIEAIVEGKLKAYYKEVCFLQQPYLKNSKQSVEQVLESRSKEIGERVTIGEYLRWSVK